MNMNRKLRYLWAYCAADEWTEAWHQRQMDRRRRRGFDVEHFCVSPPSLKRRWLEFPVLDRRWRAGERELMKMYEDLAARLEGRDVLILYNGANLHPEFTRQLKMMKVYASADPEYEDVLAKPCGATFDVHLVHSPGRLDVHRSWGLKHVYFWPLGSLMSEEDVPDIQESTIGDMARRTLPAVLFCHYWAFRNDRLDRLQRAFPDALYAGAGWPRGFMSWEEMWASYRRAQIGWNIHNTVGFNFRTFELPAFGVMQICDNKSDLSHLYDLGKEVVGFDTTEECIEWTRYYLAHPEEQRQIALAGWKRWKRDYTPDRIWDRLVSIVEENRPRFAKPALTSSHTESFVLHLREHRKRVWFQRMLWTVGELLRRIVNKIRYGLIRQVPMTDLL